MEPSETVTAAGRTLPVYGGKGDTAPLFLLIAEGEEAASVWQAARALTSAPFRLAAFPAENWNDALSPWPAEPVFRGGEPFGGRAEETLGVLVSRVLPALREALEAPTAPCFLLGYSLAGLFSLWSLYRTEAFAGAVSASGSLWFPGFAEYALGRSFAGRPEKLCFSLGDREKNTRNPLMARVQDDTEAVFRRVRDLGIPCTFRLDPGGHFRDPERRLGLGIAWMLDGEPQE
jgi:predicted alpha/beta superfamily hydrolase